MIKSYGLIPFFLFSVMAFCLVNSTAQNSKIDSLSALLKTDKEDTNKVKHLNDLAKEYTFTNPDTSILLSQQALELANAIKTENPNGWINGITKSSNQLGNCYYLIGNYSKALEYYFIALRLNREMGNKKAVGANLGNIGNVYSDLGDYPLALEYHFKALKLSEETNNKKGEGSNLGNIGNVYNEQGDYPQALKYYFKALKLNEEIGNNINVGVNLGNIGNVYNAQGDYLLALEYYFKALKLNEEIGNKNQVAFNLCNMGELYTNQKKYKDGEKYLLRSLKISTEIGSLELMKDINEKLSKLYSNTNRFDLAYKYHVDFSDVKDSLFNDDKSKEIGRLETRHEMEKAEMERLAQEEAERKTKLDAKNRKDLLQYSGILLLLLLIGLVVVVLAFKKVSPQVASGVTFFAFLLLFEFFLVYLDPYIDKLSSGEPAYKLALNAVLAGCIFPLHAFFNKILKRKLVKKA